MKIVTKKIGIDFSRKKNISGQALLLSLLIMAGITAAGIGFATLIISQIKAAENIDNSISATYGAESGLEKALHIVKINRLNSTTLADTITEIETVSKTFSTAGLSVVFDEDAISSEEVNNKFSLQQDESRQIDFYNPDDPFGATTNIAALYLSWDNNPVPISEPPWDYDDGYGTGPEWVEVSWTGWDLDGNSFENVEKELYSGADLFFDADLCHEDSYIQCTIIPLDPDMIGLSYYQVRVKALHAGIDDVEIKALDVGLNLVPIPSRVHIKTVGKYGRTQQALNASLPWKIPSSGIFDYVIFSEEQINKTPETNYQTSGKIEIERGIADDEFTRSCECTADLDVCSDWPICNGTSKCTDLGFVVEYWEPSVECNKNELADIGTDIRSSGWGNCNLQYYTDACFATQEHTKITKLISIDDLPYDEGNYYVSLRGLYNSNQNSETMAVIIDDGSCDPDTTCQRVEVKDLFTSMANPSLSEYKTCVSQSKVYIEPGDSVIFEYGNEDEANIVHLDWYQFSNGVPPGVSERCDSDFIPLRIQMENGISRSEGATECACVDALCKDPGSDCLAIGWEPGTFGDFEAPLVECFKYSNETKFPSTGNDRWDIENRAYGWGACLLNKDRWMRYVVPAGVTSGPYYLSVRAGFTSGSGNIVKAEVYDGPAGKSTLLDTFISNDLWGAANSPKNAFVECTFPNHVNLESGNEIKFLAPDNDIYIDWYEITDSPPGYRSCNDSAVLYGVIPPK